MSDNDNNRGLFINKKKPKSASPAVDAAAPRKDVQRRWVYIGIGVVTLVVISTSLFGSKRPVAAPAVAKNTGMVNTNPLNADKDAFTSKFAVDLERVKVEQDRLRQESAAKDKQIEDLLKAGAGGTGRALPPGITPPPVQGTTNTGGLASVGAPPPPLPPSIPPVGGSPPAPTFSGLVPTLSTPAPSDAPLVFDAPSIASAAPASTAVQGGVEARTSYKKNPSAGMIPAGAFAPIALLNGVDAGTATSTQSNPMPILMNVLDQATLPGSAKYRLKNCFVLASAYGDLSAERVYARISRLSCVDKGDRLVLSQEVQGYLVDSDGKLGLRGMITDRQGAKVGKALLAGFAQGLAGALGTAQSTVSTNAATGTSTSQLGGASALRAAGLSGAQTATSQLAEFYLKEAQNIFPVITVDAGRTGTIVFTASTSLAWGDGDSQFVQQVQPK